MRQPAGTGPQEPRRAPALAKRFLVGRMLAATRRLARAFPRGARAQVAERRDRRTGRVPPPTARRREVRSVVCVPVGPGRQIALADTLESLLASDGDASQIVVVDDASVDSREAVVRARFPMADVVRNRRPTGGPPNMWRQVRLGIEHALARYDFEQWVKLDTDAIVLAPGFSERTIARVAAAPGTGLAGSCGVRADGVPEDAAYHAAVLAREVGRDRTLAAAADRARAAGWPPGEVVQAGVCILTRAGAAALAREGWLAWRRPWHSQVSEDLALSLFVRACGLGLLSIGGPDGILAVANKHLPLAKEALAAGPWVAAHSVRRGLQGEDEAALRAYFREARTSWPPR